MKTGRGQPQKSLSRTPPRVGIRICVVAATGAFLFSCGLPTISYLAPPLNPSFDGVNEENYILQFEHNPDNDTDDFRGYEIYYKLYEPDAALIDSDESYIESTPTTSGPGRLEARHFLRAAPTISAINGAEAIVTDDTAPSIELSPTGTVIEFELDLRTPNTRSLADDDTHIIVSWTEEGDTHTLELRRRSTEDSSVGSPLDDYDGFWDEPEYADDDYDIAQMISGGVSSPVGKLVIVLYVLTYGIDATDFNPYYSEPVRLEPATIVTG